MLSDEQIDHYRTFGFLVLPGYLDEQETAALTAERTAPTATPSAPATTSGPTTAASPATTCR